MSSKEDATKIICDDNVMGSRSLFPNRSAEGGRLAFDTVIGQVVFVQRSFGNGVALIGFDSHEVEAFLSEP